MLFLEFDSIPQTTASPDGLRGVLNIKIPGWQRFKAADDWLAEHAHATTSAVDCARSTAS